MALVPEHRPKVIDARSSVQLNNEKIAQVFFEVVRNRLQHINSWPIIAENLASSFQLTNKEGIEVYRKAQEGDYIKIRIESPESKNITTADWVKIHSLSDLSNDDGLESFGFTMLKSDGPTLGRKDGIYHYGEALCRFIVARHGKAVTASIIENDKTHEPQTPPTATKSATVGRLAHVDWQKLSDGLVSR